MLIQGPNTLSTGGAYTSNGPLIGAIAYLQTGSCGFNGENCITVETTLVCTFPGREDCMLMDASRKTRPPPEPGPARICRSLRRAYRARLTSRTVTKYNIFFLGTPSPSLLASGMLQCFPPLAGEADDICSYYNGCDGAGADCELH
jgi:hypothetical protein